MAVTVGVNNQTVVHKGSGGVSVAAPDVCLTQVGNAVVPIPYPNIARSSDLANGAASVLADGNPMGHEKSQFSTSTGDEAGSRKGVASGTVKGIAEFVSFSPNVFVEGNAVVRGFDLMIHNTKNTPPATLMQPPLIQAIVEETPEIPEQDALIVQVIGPLGKPLDGLPFEMTVDGKTRTVTTMAKGRLVHVSDKESCEIELKHEELGIEVDEE